MKWKIIQVKENEKWPRCCLCDNTIYSTDKDGKMCILCIKFLQTFKKEENMDFDITMIIHDEFGNVVSQDHGEYPRELQRLLQNAKQSTEAWKEENLAAYNDAQNDMAEDAREEVYMSQIGEDEPDPNTMDEELPDTDGIGINYDQGPLFAQQTPLKDRPRKVKVEQRHIEVTEAIAL